MASHPINSIWGNGLKQVHVILYGSLLHVMLLHVFRNYNLGMVYSVKSTIIPRNLNDLETNLRIVKVNNSKLWLLHMSGVADNKWKKYIVHRQRHLISNLTFHFEFLQQSNWNESYSNNSNRSSIYPFMEDKMSFDLKDAWINYK